MGRPIKIKETDLAYIAGFLDGDGSVVVQLKNRKNSLRGWRLMFTICLYQDTRHEKPLYWMRKILGIGYICRRNDNITKLRINGYERTRTILGLLKPFIKFKKKQVSNILKILKLLGSHRSLFDLKKSDRSKIANAILIARSENYQSGSKRLEKLKIDLEKIKAA